MRKDIILQNIKHFMETNALPNILLYGNSIQEQKDVIEYILSNMYTTQKERKEHVIYINCAFGKGIRFIREDLKFFAKSNLDSILKSIVLLFAEELTIDAQSALRRSIEVFHKSTRFFIITQNKNRIMKPILSRFCIIHVETSWSHKLKDNLSYQWKRTPITKSVLQQLCKRIDEEDTSSFHIYKEVFQLYHERGVMGIDFIMYIQQHEPQNYRTFVLLTYMNRLRRNIKNDILLLYSLLVMYKMRHNMKLENILIK